MPSNKKPRHRRAKKLPAVFSPECIASFKAMMEHYLTVAHITVAMGKIDINDAAVLRDMLNMYTTLLICREDLDRESVMAYFYDSFFAQRTLIFNWLKRGVATGVWTPKGDELRAVREVYTDIGDCIDELMKTEKGFRLAIRGILCCKQLCSAGKNGPTEFEVATIRKHFRTVI